MLYLVARDMEKEADPLKDEPCVVLDWEGGANLLKGGPCVVVIATERQELRLVIMLTLYGPPPQ